MKMKGRTKWLLLLALGLLVVVAAVAEEAPKNENGGGRMAFKMNSFDEDEDDEEVAETHTAAEEPAAVNEDTEEEEEAAEQNAASETPKETPKTLKRKQRHIYDDDEFEGTAEVKQHTRKPVKVSVDSLKKQQEAAQLAEKQKKEQELLQPRDWRMEMLFISFISLYLVWFVIGMIINTRKAHRWLNNMHGFLDEQFAQIGDPVRHITDLERESFHQFYLQTTGRINVIGARFLLDVCITFSIIHHHSSIMLLLLNR